MYPRIKFRQLSYHVINYLGNNFGINNITRIKNGAISLAYQSLNIVRRKVRREVKDPRIGIRCGRRKKKIGGNLYVSSIYHRRLGVVYNTLLQLPASSV